MLTINSPNNNLRYVTKSAVKFIDICTNKSFNKNSTCQIQR